MFRITDVVKHLAITNVVIYALSWILFQENRNILALYYPASEHFQPYQLVTHIFMHADVSHLFFNMLTLIFLGPTVEALWGSRRFLFYYLFAGFGAIIAHLIIWYFSVQSIDPIFYESAMNNVNSYVLGASGAVYGITAAFGLLFPERELQLLFIPVPIKAKYLAFGLILLDSTLGISGRSTGVAHFAHLGGAFAGAFLIMYWQKYGSKL